MNYEKFKMLLENTFLMNSLFFILTIISIIMTVVFYYKSIRRKIPIYAIKNVSLVEDSINKLNKIDILYNGHKVENLSVSRIAFWNQGEETINSSDITLNDPIKIVSLDTASLLGIEVIYEANKINNFVLLPVTSEEDPTIHNQNEMLINFDYIDKNEGVIIQVFHTGKTANEIKLQGTVKGYGVIKKLNDPLIKKINPAKYLDKYLEKLKIGTKKKVFGIILILIPFILIFSQYYSTPETRTTSLILVNKIMIYVTAIMYWFMAYEILKRRVPKGFDLFEEKIKL